MWYDSNAIYKKHVFLKILIGKGGCYNMRNKTICICCALIITFFCFTDNIVLATESPPEKQYIVKFNNEMALFHSEQGEQLNLLSESELQECKDAGIVEWYEEDFSVELLEGTQTETENQQYDKWDLEIIESNASIDIGCYGQEIKIAVIDSGIVEHEDLAGNIREGYNYLNNTTDVIDNIGHGTFVSGLIAAEMNEYGIVGVAPKAEIIPLKCFDTGTTTTVSVIKKAIEDAVDKYNVDIINMSFGLTQYSQTLENAINHAIDNGVIVVAAVGNKGTETLYYPAAFENVIGVGSIDSNCDKSDFSQFNQSVDVVAPGENVYSTTNTNGYGSKNGTSFSTPIVTGTIAFMMNVNANIDLEYIMTVLCATSVDKGETGYDIFYGNGIINIKNIKEYMLEGVGYFISPIDVTDEGSSVVVYNNTDNVLEATFFMNNYRKDALMDFENTDLKIESNKCLKIPSAYNKNKIKCYIWKNISDIKVLGMFREREVN